MRQVAEGEAGLPSSWLVYLAQAHVGHLKLVLVDGSAQAAVKQLHSSTQSALTKTNQSHFDKTRPAPGSPEAQLWCSGRRLQRRAASRLSSRTGW